jgi:plasmid stability protein
MATLLIRDVPDEVHAALLAQAERSRRSKEKHALFLIEGGLRGQKPVKQTLAEAAKLRANCKRPVKMAEILKWTEEAH